MQAKRKRKHKRKHKRTAGATLDKRAIIKRLLKLNFSIDRIIRAIKVYEHNYGKHYDFNALIEIIVRLQRKDAAKHDINGIDSKEEEKRNTTKYIVDDMKDNTYYSQHNSLSLSVSSSAHNIPITMDTNKKHKTIQLLRRHTTENVVLHENYQYKTHKTRKTHKTKQKTHTKHRKSISIEYERYAKSKCNNNCDAFVSYMSLSAVSALSLYDNIDHRDFVGKFCIATIVEIDCNNKYNIRIHYDGYSDNKYDIWCNYKNELHRFAKYRSISRRVQSKNSSLDRDGHTDGARVYKCDISIGDFVFLNPIYTRFGNKWYRGIINRFDKKSDQIQIAFKPKKTSNDHVLYWSHIDNMCEIKAYHKNAPIMEAYELQQLPEQVTTAKVDAKKKKGTETLTAKMNENCFSEWTSQQVIEWINSIENGKFNDEIFDHFKQQIEIIQLKGYELTTLNETALKFAGLLNKFDRKVIINNILNLVNKNNMQSTQTALTNYDDIIEYSLDGKETIDIDLNLKLKKCKNELQCGGISDDEQCKDDNVLSEVMGLWKSNV